MQRLIDDDDDNNNNNNNLYAQLINLSTIKFPYKKVQ